jgi:penicillin-binding protein 2
MSFHPNQVLRRSRIASVLVAGILLFLLTGFFRTQILDHDRYALQSEKNRLREVPLPAPRGTIYDRNGAVIAESVVGYSISMLAPTPDSLRASLERLREMIPISDGQVETALRRWRQNYPRPAVILADASFDVVSVLEEHRHEYPGLIIQSAPKRFYPDGAILSAFVGYTAEINERELLAAEYAGYRMGHQIGKQGLEKQYESILRGAEGTRFVEVDARGRIVRENAARDLIPTPGTDLRTTIDLPLQRFVDSLFADSLIGGVVAMIPQTGEVLAIYSAPTYDVNRFIGGIPADYWNALREDPRRPLYNKALQGRYPPASTWKLITSAIALENNVVRVADRFPISCSGGMQYGARYFRCWDRRGHGSLDMIGAIARSCDVYFYQLGLRITLSRLLASGISMGVDRKTGIDLPEEIKPRWPEAISYYNQRYGPRGWSNAVVLNLSIGQGENDQTVLSLARLFTAFATDGWAATPTMVKREPRREQLLHLSGADMDQLRLSMAEVVSARGTAGASAIQGVVLAGKTGTAQNSADADRDHALFVGFAPANDPKILVSVILEFGMSGSRAARIASRIVARYLGVEPEVRLQTDG